jgi:pimeloyl-ACP methyl ester carboxylesterase
MKRAAAALGVVVLLVVGAGCTGDESPGGTARLPPAFAETTCPTDVEASVLAPISCGYLSVPEDRAAPGRTLRLFVIRVEPPERRHQEPVLVAGTNIGNGLNYGGIAPIAQRLGREAILLDPRGTGHSEPSLACPEVEALQSPSLGLATTDPGARESFLSAVARCRERLESDGTDLDAYTVAAMAQDVEDLRTALGIDSWNVHTYGTSARTTLELLRTDPGSVRAAFLDSPQPPQVDPRVEGAAALRTALAEVDSRCRAEARCRRLFASPADTLVAALHRLDRRPVDFTVDDPASGDQVRVHVDGVMLLRLLRAVLADGGSSGTLYLPESVPALVSLAAQGRLAELAPLLRPLVAEDSAYCLGYVPKCQPQMALSEGALYSALCRDAGMPYDPGGIAAAVGRQPAYAEMFEQSPYVEVCSAWGEVPRTAGPTAPLDSDVPALVLVGGFAPYNRSSAIRTGLAGLRRSTVLVNPAHGHNVLIGACFGELRRRWHEDFSLTRRDRSCIDDRLRWTSEAELLRTARTASG